MLLASTSVSKPRSAILYSILLSKFLRFWQCCIYMFWYIVSLSYFDHSFLYDNWIMDISWLPVYYQYLHKWVSLYQENYLDMTVKVKDELIKASSGLTCLTISMCFRDKQPATLKIKCLLRTWKKLKQVQRSSMCVMKLRFPWVNRFCH